MNTQERRLYWDLESWKLVSRTTVLLQQETAPALTMEVTLSLSLSFSLCLAHSLSFSPSLSLALLPLPFSLFIFQSFSVSLPIYFMALVVSNAIQVLPVYWWRHHMLKNDVCLFLVLSYLPHWWDVIQPTWGWDLFLLSKKLLEKLTGISMRYLAITLSLSLSLFLSLSLYLALSLSVSLSLYLALSLSPPLSFSFFLFFSLSLFLSLYLPLYLVLLLTLSVWFMLFYVYSCLLIAGRCFWNKWSICGTVSSGSQRTQDSSWQG